MNAQLILIHAALFMFLFPSAITEQPPADTLKIKSVGENNSIIVDSMHWQSQVYDTTTAQSVIGAISQTGENNQVEINIGGEAPKSKAQITNKHPKTQNPETCNPKPATIKIKQTGKNNSVKINQK